MTQEQLVKRIFCDLSGIITREKQRLINEGQYDYDGSVGYTVIKNISGDVLDLWKTLESFYEHLEGE